LLGSTCDYTLGFERTERGEEKTKGIEALEPCPLPGQKVKVAQNSVKEGEKGVRRARIRSPHTSNR
jgi:hypothetical protein